MKRRKNVTSDKIIYGVTSILQVYALSLSRSLKKKTLQNFNNNRKLSINWIENIFIKICMCQNHWNTQYFWLRTVKGDGKVVASLPLLRILPICGYYGYYRGSVSCGRCPFDSTRIFPVPHRMEGKVFTECLSGAEDIFCSGLVVRRKLCVVLFDISRMKAPFVPFFVRTKLSRAFSIFFLRHFFL